MGRADLGQERSFGIALDPAVDQDGLADRGLEQGAIVAVEIPVEDDLADDVALARVALRGLRSWNRGRRRPVRNDQARARRSRSRCMGIRGAALASRILRR